VLRIDLQADDMNGASFQVTEISTPSMKRTPSDSALARRLGEPGIRLVVIGQRDISSAVGHGPRDELLGFEQTVGSGRVGMKIDIQRGILPEKLLDHRREPLGLIVMDHMAASAITRSVNCRKHALRAARSALDIFSISSAFDSAPATQRTGAATLRQQASASSTRIEDRIDPLVRGSLASSTRRRASTFPVPREERAFPPLKRELLPAQAPRRARRKNRSRETPASRLRAPRASARSASGAFSARAAVSPNPSRLIKRATRPGRMPAYIARDVAAHAVADERRRSVRLEAREQGLQVGKIIRKPVAVACRPLGEVRNRASPGRSRASRRAARSTRNWNEADTSIHHALHEAESCPSSSGPRGALPLPLWGDERAPKLFMLHGLDGRVGFVPVPGGRAARRTGA